MCVVSKQSGARAIASVCVIHSKWIGMQLIRCTMCNLLVLDKVIIVNYGLLHTMVQQTYSTDIHIIKHTCVQKDMDSSSIWIPRCHTMPLFSVDTL